MAFKIDSVFSVLRELRLKYADELKAMAPDERDRYVKVLFGGSPLLRECIREYLQLLDDGVVDFSDEGSFSRVIPKREPISESRASDSSQLAVSNGGPSTNMLNHAAIPTATPTPDVGTQSCLSLATSVKELMSITSIITPYFQSENSPTADVLSTLVNGDPFMNFAVQNLSLVPTIKNLLAVSDTSTSRPNQMNHFFKSLSTLGRLIALAGKFKQATNAGEKKVLLINYFTILCDLAARGIGRLPLQ